MKKKKHNTTAKKNKELTLVGVIIPAKWDEDGNPIAVSIATEEEKEFLIDTRTKRGKAFFSLMHENVKITGILGGRALNLPVIRVQGFTHYKQP